MQKGLDLLLHKYSVNAKAVLSSEGKTVEIDGKEFPVLSWESERRFIELRNLVVTSRLGNMCTYRIGHTSKKGTDLFELLAREVGILEFTINSTVKEIFAIAGKNTMNCIVETKNGCVCTIELGATLEEGQKDVDKHEIITDNGVGCDRVVDTQIPQSSIYILGENERTFTDTDAELYGYEEKQINIIRNAFATAKNEDMQNTNVKKWAHIQKVVEGAKRSLATLENVKVGE